MTGKDTEKAGVLRGAAERLAAMLELRIDALATQPVDSNAVEKDAKTLTALARAAVTIHAVKACEDRAAIAHTPQTQTEGDEMEPDGSSTDGRDFGHGSADMEQFRRDIERRFDVLAQRLERKGLLPSREWGPADVGRGPSGPQPLLADAGEPGSAPPG